MSSGEFDVVFFLNVCLQLFILVLECPAEWEMGGCQWMEDCHQTVYIRGMRGGGGGLSIQFTK